MATPTHEGRGQMYKTATAGGIRRAIRKVAAPQQEAAEDEDSQLDDDKRIQLAKV
jgi:hypothetical protein